jgi:hypothetical protein
LGWNHPDCSSALLPFLLLKFLLRQIEQWKNAVACQLQKYLTQEQLQKVWNAVEFDHTQHQQQYADSILPFLKKIRAKCQESISTKSQIDAMPIEQTTKRDRLRHQPN